MAQPTGSDLHVNRPLTNISVAYMQADTNFAADTVFPSVPVDMKSNMYYIYNKGDWYRTAAQKRAPRTESAGTGWNITKDSYLADVQAVHTDIDDQDRATQDRPVIDIDRDGTLLVSRDIMLRRELDWVDANFKAGTWTGMADQVGAATAGVNQFIQWNRSSSTPIEQMQEYVTNLAESTGYIPNVLVIGRRVFNALKQHPELIERIKYTQRGVLTLELIASLLDLDKVVVPMGVQNTAEEGKPDDMNFIFGKSALLVYAAPNAGLLQPSAGYTFEWTGYTGAQVRGTRIKKFRMEALNSDRIECESAYDFKVVCPDMGVFMSTVVQ